MMVDALLAQEQEDDYSNCSCKEECTQLHVSRLPLVVREEDNYLSYENFPVLCRDAASIMLPASPPSKKYVCKQTFDCCRECNHAFYTCISMAGYTYGACMRGAYKCMCDCIDQKSYSELPYKLPTLPATTKPIATTATAKP
ncbi:unnamed protein product [Porites evermanni]|uniref:Uncharacterized protein n=2 Tax=Porites evermanni TaxID=104178 RepID=A0ABN8M5A1_9CNID|nr:unnamed protein product [Porites evermanni]